MKQSPAAEKVLKELDPDAVDELIRVRYARRLDPEYDYRQRRVEQAEEKIRQIQIERQAQQGRVASYRQEHVGNARRWLLGAPIALAISGGSFWAGAEAAVTHTGVVAYAGIVISTGFAAKAAATAHRDRVARKIGSAFESGFDSAEQQAREEIQQALDLDPTEAERRQLEHFGADHLDSRMTTTDFADEHGHTVRRGHPLFDSLGARPDERGFHQDRWDDAFVEAVIAAKTGRLDSPRMEHVYSAAMADRSTPDAALGVPNDRELRLPPLV